ncbi:hypothetical protein Pnap_4222 (plasmid) [Polaromonas naphthalenivorans CJ2]|uniref:Uncharacterized protein n=2 Tax=Polaromonas naphthalenivorans TaxID=216465 RepID=A1VV27_POLNA|nr:hypothetical protein Pnap_4222 [Polaromonas naphthalenivorans CJ2]
MVLPYETMVSSFAAQDDIKEFLEFLGASDVLFGFDSNMDCSVQWSRKDEVSNFPLNANGYIAMWMRARPWKRRPVVSERLNEQQEIELAVINFWYVLRDFVFSEVPKRIFDQEKMLKVSEQQTQLLVKRMTLGTSA